MIKTKWLLQDMAGDFIEGELTTRGLYKGTYMKTLWFNKKFVRDLLKHNCANPGRIRLTFTKKAPGNSDRKKRRVKDIQWGVLGTKGHDLKMQVQKSGYKWVGIEINK